MRARGVPGPGGGLPATLCGPSPAPPHPTPPPHPVPKVALFSTGPAFYPEPCHPPLGASQVGQDSGSKQGGWEAGGLEGRGGARGHGAGKSQKGVTVLRGQIDAGRFLQYNLPRAPVGKFQVSWGWLRGCAQGDSQDRFLSPLLSLVLTPESCPSLEGSESWVMGSEG